MEYDYKTLKYVVEYQHDMNGILNGHLVVFENGEHFQLYIDGNQEDRNFWIDLPKENCVASFETQDFEEEDMDEETLDDFIREHDWYHCKVVLISKSGDEEYQWAGQSLEQALEEAYPFRYEDGVELRVMNNEYDYDTVDISGEAYLLRERAPYFNMRMICEKAGVSYNSYRGWTTGRTLSKEKKMALLQTMNRV